MLTKITNEIYNYNIKRINETKGGAVLIKLDTEKLLLFQAKACLNSNELSKKANMPRTTLSNIVHGKRNATPKTIGLLAKALDVDVIELLVKEE